MFEREPERHRELQRIVTVDLKHSFISTRSFLSVNYRFQYTLSFIAWQTVVYNSGAVMLRMWSIHFPVSVYSLVNTLTIHRFLSQKNITCYQSCVVNGCKIWDNWCGIGRGLTRWGEERQQQLWRLFLFSALLMDCIINHIIVSENNGVLAARLQAKKMADKNNNYEENIENCTWACN